MADVTTTTTFLSPEAGKDDLAKMAELVAVVKAENARLRSALEPLARIAHAMDNLSVEQHGKCLPLPHTDSTPLWMIAQSLPQSKDWLTLGDCRRAAEALATPAQR